MLDDLLEDENKILKLLTDLKCQKHHVLNNIAVLKSKLIKFDISPKRIDRIKNPVLLSYFMSFANSNSILKTVF